MWQNHTSLIQSQARGHTGTISASSETQKQQKDRAQTANGGQHPTGLLTVQIFNCSPVLRVRWVNQINLRILRVCPSFVLPLNPSGWILGTISSQKEGWCGGTAAQGGGGVAVPGGVQELWGCGTEGCGQWARWGGLDNLTRVFPTLMILWFLPDFRLWRTEPHVTIHICIQKPMKETSRFLHHQLKVLQKEYFCYIQTTWQAFSAHTGGMLSRVQATLH